jgi:hypothetical protein
LAPAKHNIMTSKLYPITRKAIIAAASLIMLFNISSCTKKTNADDAKKFVASWKGSQNCGIGGSTSNKVISITQGSDGVTATTTVTVGAGSCAREQTITGTAHEDVLNFSEQTISDGCGYTYDITGFASITGTSLSLSVTAVDRNGVSNTCNFTGTMQ